MVNLIPRCCFFSLLYAVGFEIFDAFWADEALSTLGVAIISHAEPANVFFADRFDQNFKKFRTDAWQVTVNPALRTQVFVWEWLNNWERHLCEKFLKLFKVRLWTLCHFFLSLCGIEVVRIAAYATPIKINCPAAADTKGF